MQTSERKDQTEPKMRKLMDEGDGRVVVVLYQWATGTRVSPRSFQYGNKSLVVLPNPERDNTSRAKTPCVMRRMRITGRGMLRDMVGSFMMATGVVKNVDAQHGEGSSK